MPKSFVAFAASSTFTIKRGAGTYFGSVISPGAGGTVQIADLADVQTNTVAGLNINTAWPSSITAIGPFPASPLPQDYMVAAVDFVSGLTLSVTSTTSITVHYQ